MPAKNVQTFQFPKADKIQRGLIYIYKSLFVYNKTQPEGVKFCALDEYSFDIAYLRKFPSGEK